MGSTCAVFEPRVHGRFRRSREHRFMKKPENRGIPCSRCRRRRATAGEGEGGGVVYKSL